MPYNSEEGKNAPAGVYGEGMNRDKTRMTVYILVGGYLLYLAYGLYGGLAEMTDDKMIFIAAMVVFAIVGVALIIVGIRGLGKAMKQDDSEDESAEIESEKDSEDEPAETESEKDSEDESADHRLS